MPFALTTIGLVFIIVGLQDTYKAFFTQVISDFSGTGNFFYWIVVLFLIGSIGYIDNKGAKQLSNAGLFLILVLIFLSNDGFFAKFTQSLQSGTTSEVNPIGASLPAPPASGGGGGSGGSSDGLSSAISIGATIASFL